MVRPSHYALLYGILNFFFFKSLFLFWFSSVRSLFLSPPLTKTVHTMNFPACLKYTVAILCPCAFAVLCAGDALPHLFPSRSASPHSTRGNALLISLDLARQSQASSNISNTGTVLLKKYIIPTLLELSIWRSISQGNSRLK